MIDPNTARLSELRDAAERLPSEIITALDVVAQGEMDFGAAPSSALEFGLERTLDLLSSMLSSRGRTATSSLDVSGVRGSVTNLSLGTRLGLLRRMWPMVESEFESSLRSIDLNRELDASSFPAAFEVARLFGRLQASLDAKSELWSSDDIRPRLKSQLTGLLAEKGSNPSKQSDTFDLVEPLITIRNRWSHTSAGAVKWGDGFAREHLAPLMDLAVVAIFELLVAGPLGEILQRWVRAEVAETGTATRLGTEAKVTFTHGLRPFSIVLPVDDDDGHGIELGATWLLDVEPEPGAKAIDAQPMGPFTTVAELILHLGPSERATVEIDASGAAQVVAGSVARRDVAGRLELLCLPSSLTVGASIAPPRSDDPGLVARPSTWPTALAAAADAAQHVISTMRDGAPLVGEIGIDLPADPGVLQGMQGETSAALAGARSAFTGLAAHGQVTNLANDVQVASLGAAGVGAQPWRDRFGWVDVTSGNLVGDQLACPPIDLLLLVAVGDGHRPRRVASNRLLSLGNDEVDLTRLDDVLGSSPSRSSDGAFGEWMIELSRVIARLSTRLADEMSTVEPNPYLALLQPLRTQFGAIGVIASTCTWTAGLLFEPGAPGLEPAERWLESLGLPDTVDIVRTRSHATT